MTKERVIPKKNYVIVLILAIATCLVLGYFVRWYRLREEGLQPASVVTQAITEINFDEIENYLLENPNVFIYVSNPQVENTQNFEKELRDYLKEEELQHRMVYLDLSKMTEQEQIQFSQEWLELDQVVEPNMIVIENGEKKDQLYRTATAITMNDVKTMINHYEVNES